MIQTIGALLLASGAAFIGIASAMQEKKTLRILQEFATIVDLLDTEIRFCLQPLPGALYHAAQSCDTALGEVLSQTARAMELDPACSAFRALEQTKLDSLLPSDGMRIAHALFRCLGRSDIEGQLKAIEAARQGISALISSTEQQQPGKSKSFCALGISAALILVILLV